MHDKVREGLIAFYHITSLRFSLRPDRTAKARITATVPVRLMKRDLLFVVERLASLLGENRLAIVARQHGIKQAKNSDSIAKLFAAYLHRAEESVLGSLLVESPSCTRPPATMQHRYSAMLPLSIR